MAECEIFSVSITPNPVYVGKSYIISAEIQPTEYVLDTGDGTALDTGDNYVLSIGED